MRRLIIIPFIAGIFVYPAYLLFNFGVDMRLEKLRPFIEKQAIGIAVETAYATWEAKYSQNETYEEKRRKVRDRKLREFIKKLDRAMDE